MEQKSKNKKTILQLQQENLENKRQEVLLLLGDTTKKHRSIRVGKLKNKARQLFANKTTTKKQYEQLQLEIMDVYEKVEKINQFQLGYLQELVQTMIYALYALEDVSQVVQKPVTKPTVNFSKEAVSLVNRIVKLKAKYTNVVSELAEIHKRVEYNEADNIRLVELRKDMSFFIEKIDSLIQKYDAIRVIPEDDS